MSQIPGVPDTPGMTFDLPGPQQEAPETYEDIFDYILKEKPVPAAAQAAVGAFIAAGRELLKENPPMAVDYVTGAVALRLQDSRIVPLCKDGGLTMLAGPPSVRIM